MKLVAFRGRIGRQKFLATTVLLYICTFVFLIVFVVGALNTDLDVPRQHVPPSWTAIKLPAAAGWILLVVGLLGFVCSVLGTIGCRCAGCTISG